MLGDITEKLLSFDLYFYATNVYHISCQKSYACVYLCRNERETNYPVTHLGLWRVKSPFYIYRIIGKHLFKKVQMEYSFECWGFDRGRETESRDRVNLVVYFAMRELASSGGLYLTSCHFSQIVNFVWFWAFLYAKRPTHGCCPARPNPQDNAPMSHHPSLLNSLYHIFLITVCTNFWNDLSSRSRLSWPVYIIHLILHLPLSSF
jgi:hypothetical protein